MKAMRGIVSRLLLVALFILALGEDTLGQKTSYRGLAVFTPFPVQAVRADEAVTLSLSVRNYGLPPQTVYLEMRQAPKDWKATFLGAGQIVKAVFVEPDGLATVNLKLEPPAGIQAGIYRFWVVARGQGVQAQLPIELTVGELPPPRLKLEAELPVLKGTPTTTFRYRVTLQNESSQDLLVSLDADAPQGAQVRFQLAFGSEEVTSLPVKAGESKSLDVNINPPRKAAAGDYHVRVRAQAGEVSDELALTAVVTGQPDLSLTGLEGRLSTRAYAGREPHSP